MIAIIDYKAGNLTSVKLAFEALGAEARVTADHAVILGAERVVFPGVGAVSSAMRNLTETGLDEVIRTVIARGTPFLGICLGTQIILSRSEEDGGVATLGIEPGTVQRLSPADPRDKVPHMGWNQVDFTVAHPLYEGIAGKSNFYFVHGFAPAPRDPAAVLATTEYGGARFASVLGRNNLVATQFHPEKSGRVGLRLLRNFMTWNGEFRC